MKPSRYLYPGGIEAIASDRGWRLLHGATDDMVFVSIHEASKALGALPAVVSALIGGAEPKSLLIEHRSKEAFGLILSDLMNRRLGPDTLYEVHHVAYTLGAVGYHCQQLAECYASISAQFAQMQTFPGVEADGRAIFGSQPAPYYEFDACVTASRRLFEACRPLLWRAFGGCVARSPAISNKRSTYS